MADMTKPEIDFIEGDAEALPVPVATSSRSCPGSGASRSTTASEALWIVFAIVGKSPAAHIRRWPCLKSSAALIR